MYKKRLQKPDLNNDNAMLPPAWPLRKWWRAIAITLTVFGLLGGTLSPLVTAYAVATPATTQNSSTGTESSSALQQAVNTETATIAASSSSSTAAASEVSSAAESSTATTTAESTATAPAAKQELKLDDLNLTSKDVASHAVTWSQADGKNTPAGTSVYLTGFKIVLNSAEAGRTFTWHKGDTITLPAVTYSGAYGTHTGKLNLTNVKIDGLGTINGDVLTVDTDDTGAALTIEVKDLTAANTVVTLATTPNLTKASSTIKFLDSTLAFTVVKLAGRAATTVNFWTKGSDVNANANAGSYGDSGLEKYVYTGSPFESIVSGSVDTVAKTAVLEKGIYGTLKWYISTDGVLHLGPGSPIASATSSTANPILPLNKVSPWYNYRSEFTQISIDQNVILPTGVNYLFASLDNINLISGADKLNFTSTTDTTGMFQNTKNLTEIKGTANWNLSGVRSTSSMFASSGIVRLDATNWGMNATTATSSMFNGTSNLTEIIGIENWNMSSTANMIYMFVNASSLKSLNLSGWKTGNVTNMSHMFEGTLALTSVNTSTWDTSKVVTMANMFNGASSITKLDFSSWDTSKVTDMTGVLKSMAKLNQITFGPSFLTTGITATAKTLALPNTVSNTKMWKNVASGSVDKPAGKEWTATFDSTINAKPDTYILTTNTAVGINVLVNDNNNNVRPNITVGLYDAKGTLITTDVTDKDGKTVFVGQEPGQYTIKQLGTIEGYIKPADELLQLSATHNSVTLTNTYDAVTTPLPVTGSNDRLWLLIITTLVLIGGGITLVVHAKRCREQNIVELKKLLK